MNSEKSISEVSPECASTPDVGTDAAADARITPSDMSPLPWRHNQTRLAGWRVQCARHRGVADYMIEGDAAYIVHAANAYPKLVAAARNYALLANAMHDGKMPECFRVRPEAVNEINTLLRELGEL